MTLSASMFEITLMAVLIGAGFQFGTELMRVLWVFGRALVKRGPREDDNV